MRTRMKKLALPLSLLALGALGVAACGGGDDDEGAPAEAQVSPDTTAEACSNPPSIAFAIRRCSRKLSPEQVQELEQGKQAQELGRFANDWASRFATKACSAVRAEPGCGRLTCGARHAVDPPEWSKNCTPVSAAFEESFADARVEEIKFKGIELVRPSQSPLYLASARFSNGVVVVFVGPAGPACAGAGSGCVWFVAEPELNRRFFQTAAPLK
jgi:hypothetical protein